MDGEIVHLYQVHESGLSLADDDPDAVLGAKRTQQVPTFSEAAV